MRTLGTPLYGGATLAPGDPCAAPGEGDVEGSSTGALVGAAVGRGFWRQIGTLGFGVGVGTGVGRGFGVGRGVGSGWGGTRGSGKRGSPAADSAWERFQSGPYAWGAPFGDGLTEIGPTD
jgi:hypothetical protein